MLESLFNLIAAFHVYNIIKKRLQQRYFSTKIAKFLKTRFISWMFLTIPRLFYKYFSYPAEITPKHLVEYFWKITDICERCFWDVSEMSRKRLLFRDMFKKSYRRHKKDIFFEMYLRRLKDVPFEMFLRRLWDVSLNGDLIEISLRHLIPAGWCLKN